MSTSDFRTLRPSQRVNRRSSVLCRRASALLNCMIGTALIALMGVDYLSGIADRSERQVIGDVVSAHERATDTLPPASLPVSGSPVSPNNIAASVSTVASLPVVPQRVSVYELATDAPPTASLRAAAWAKVKGKLFVAAVCASDPSLRLGCGGVEDKVGLPVRTVPIRSQTEDDEAALRTARRLEGAWEGDGYVLRVDGERRRQTLIRKPHLTGGVS